ncbi:phosphodiesterase [Litoreibacter janthinus]|uniref:3',5'-cyclic AMP phosphodiesterase CpdA n=1 Tax=Litoreibacter janthinus TaxID=670154 RepID=A0A1I6HMG9_9RHOB|nr:phosphodiesterase [Litoreibacter janthinus]SFR55537.1 3',5'-cyclic AMP phosphodiesterase CpdA [Litoreibacter janthinus]
MKLIVLTDTHMVESGGNIIGLEPAERLTEVLDHALQSHPDAAHLVILGDLTHHGRAAQYARLRDLLAHVAVPVSLMLGNHDDRAKFIEAFPEAPLTPSGHVQHVVQLGDHHLICLDSYDDNANPRHSGVLCEARMAWLRDALVAAQGAPVTLALHHPPFVTGLDGMDDIRLRNDDELHALIAEFPNVVQLLCGHVHRTISGGARGTPYATFKGTCHQTPMYLGVAGSDHSIDEPGGYGVVLFTDDGVIVHNDDLGPRGAPTVDGHSA